MTDTLWCRNSFSHWTIIDRHKWHDNRVSFRCTARWVRYTHICMCVCACVCAQPCLTLCDPMDCSLPGSSVHGIFQARLLERVASRGSSRPRDWTYVSWISWIGRRIINHCATWEAHPSTHTHTHTHTHTFFQFLFHYRLLQNIEYSSLCYIGVDFLFYR